MTIQKIKGNSGENQAMKYLRSLGYDVVCDQFHSKYGEIDIIAKDNDTTVFFEVKNYKKGSLANLYQSVSKSKQQKIIKTAKSYLAKYKLEDEPTRFDVVFFEDGSLIEHIKGAFFV